MSDETEDLASPIVETLTSSFAGDTRPATIEDVARVYSRIILIADAMTNLLEVAGTRDTRVVGRHHRACSIPKSDSGIPQNPLRRSGGLRRRILCPT